MSVVNKSIAVTMVVVRFTGAMSVVNKSIAVTMVVVRFTGAMRVKSYYSH